MLGEWQSFNGLLDHFDPPLIIDVRIEGQSLADKLNVFEELLELDAVDQSVELAHIEGDVLSLFGDSLHHDN